MFRNAKVGDRVYFIQGGWGTIIHIFKNKEFPIIYKSDKGMIYNFRIDGKRNILDVNPSLFWDEIKFKIPKKPFNLEEELKKLEITEFKHRRNNYFLVWDNDSKRIDYDYYQDFEIPFTTYFTEKSIDIFMENIKYKKITKEKIF